MAKLIFDPQTALLETLAGEPALPPERMTAEWLRQRFVNPPTWTPEGCEEQLLRQQERLTPAAVLIPITLRQQGATLLLTQRTAHLNDHAGQVSLPGGRMEPTDASAIETALRETEEEIGLHSRHVEVIGVLPEYCTGTGYRITPVVGIVQPPFELRLDPFEVAEIFEVPLSFLMDGRNHQRRNAELPTGKRSFYAMPYERCFIWGATAAILRNLFHFLRA